MRLEVGLLPRRLLRSRRLLEVALAVTQALGLLTSVILARTLGPAGRGVITTLTVWALVLMRSACLDMDRAVAVTSRLDGISAHETYRRARRIVWQVAIPVAVVAASVYLLVTGQVLLAIALAASVAAGARFEVSMGLLLATGDLRSFALRRLVQPIAYAVGVAAILAWSSRYHTSRHVLIVSAAAVFALSLVLAAVVANPSRLPDGDASPGRTPRAARRRLIVFGAKSQSVSLFQFLNGRLDIILVGLLMASRDVGLYAVASAAGAAIVFLGAAGFTRGLSGETSGFDVRALAAVSALSAAAIAFAPLTIRVVFGHEFADAVPAARILLAGGVFGYLATTLTGRLIGQSLPVQASIAQALGVAVLVLGTVLGPRSIETVAAASSLGYAVTAVAGHVFGRSADARVTHAAAAPDG
ncbi:MAG: hypothetical protein JWM05_2539 [Acidimicrobiales bacterium]|nr:hypothetical protein [Acidimicrobiales bacterium]